MNPNLMSQQKRQRPRNNLGTKPRGGKVSSLHENGNVVEGRSKNQLMQSMDRYLNLAREAQSGGDRVTAEGFFQQADHYYRLLSLLNEPAPERHAPPAARIPSLSETAVQIEEELMEVLGKPEEDEPLKDA